MVADLLVTAAEYGVEQLPGGLQHIDVGALADFVSAMEEGYDVETSASMAGVSAIIGYGIGATGLPFAATAAISLILGSAATNEIKARSGDVFIP